MKKITRAFAVVLLALTLCMSLTACSTISGTYSAEVLGTGTTMEFKGSKVRISITTIIIGEVASIEAKYKIKDDKITFDLDPDENITSEAAKRVLATLEQPLSFEKGDGYIKIGGVKYTEKE